MGRGGSKSKASIKPDRSETPAAATDPMSNSEIHQDMDLDEGYNTGNVVGDGGQYSGKIACFGHRC